MVWEAQVVIKGCNMRSCPSGIGKRGRDASGGWKERLYALRRRFVVVVDQNAIALKVLGSSRPWWSTRTPRQVIVKNRLVKVISRDNGSIVIRLADEDKAVTFALTVRSELGIDSLARRAADCEASMQQRELEQMAALFLSSPEFRQRVQQMHGGLESVWNVGLR